MEKVTPISSFVLLLWPKKYIVGFGLLELPVPFQHQIYGDFFSPKQFTGALLFPVESGQTMELVVAQFWSSGIGSRETAIVDFEVIYVHSQYIMSEWMLLCSFNSDS